MTICDPKVIKTLARFEEKWKQQEECNDKIDDIHKIICGNGDEGLADKVRSNGKFIANLKKVMWLVLSGTVLAVLGIVFGAIV